LRFPQGKIQRTHLQQAMGVFWRESQGHPTVHDVFSQTQGDIGYAVFRGFMANRVIVKGAGYAGEGGVEAITMSVTADLFQDDGHFFLVDDVRSGHHIGFAALVESGSVYGLDGFLQK